MKIVVYEIDGVRYHSDKIDKVSVLSMLDRILSRFKTKVIKITFTKMLKKDYTMILSRPSYKIVQMLAPEDFIEKVGRVCTKSEHKITSATAESFIDKRIKQGHESIIEHTLMTVHFICDRGVSHELVRHRLCSFTQESTRYCNYKGGVEFIIPPRVVMDEGEYDLGDDFSQMSPRTMWFRAMLRSEKSYLDLLEEGWSPQMARSVLPNSLKTELYMTANLREWRHIFKLRCASSAHPQMRELMRPLFNEVKSLIFFGGIDVN